MRSTLMRNLTIALLLITLSLASGSPTRLNAQQPAAASVSDAAAAELQSPTESTELATESTELATESPQPAQSESTPIIGSEVTGSEVTDDARLRDLLSLVKDNTLNIHPRENPAYYELIKAIMARSTDQLQNETTLNPRFNDLYKSPDKYRGQLVHLNLHARLILPIDIQVSNVANVTRLYEIWGWTDEAKAHMYCCVVPELPPEFPTEGNPKKRVDLVGYFFKMQAYQPGGAAPDARNLVAPLIIGRITYAGPVTRKANDPLGNWPMVLIIGFGTIVMLRLMMHLRGMTRSTPTFRNYRRRSLEPIDPDSLADALGDTDRGLRIRNATDP